MRLILNRQAFGAMMGSVGADERRADPSARAGAGEGKAPSRSRAKGPAPRTPSF